MSWLLLVYKGFYVVCVLFGLACLGWSCMSWLVLHDVLVVMYEQDDVLGVLVGLGCCLGGSLMMCRRSWLLCCRSEDLS